MKKVLTQIANDKTKKDYLKIHIEDAIALERDSFTVLEWLESREHEVVPLDVWNAAENMSITTSQGWKKL